MNLKGVMIFVAGVGVGAVGGYFVTKKLMREHTEAEIQSVKDAFKQIAEEEKKALETSDKEKEVAVRLNEYRGEDMNVERRSGDTEIGNKRHLEEKKDEPYCIDPDLFAEEYETEYLTYYADGVLAYDDTGEIIEHPDEVIGKENLYHFGEFEEDMLYVRDPVDKVDYSIAHSDKPYPDRG